MPAVAMTDHGNLFGAVQFYNTAKDKASSPSSAARSTSPSRATKPAATDDRYNHLVLLCENQEGYRNLINLVSTGYLEGFYYKPRIDKDLLAQHSKGLIALSACLRGDINETLLADSTKTPSASPTPTRTCSARITSSSKFRTMASNRTSASCRSVVPPRRGNRHPAGRHQRLPLPAQRRRPRARDPALHPDRQDHVSDPIADAAGPPRTSTSRPAPR